MPDRVLETETGIERIEYLSRGSCLVIGGERAVHIAVAECVWPSDVRPSFFVVDKLSVKLKRECALLGFECITGVPEKIEGHLGRFNLTAKASYPAQQTYDLVLDLQQPPMLTMELKPFGYFTANDDPGQIQRAVEGLNEWIGLFEKPKYFNYDDTICAHGNGRIQGCHSCLDLCSAGAIVSSGTKIQVDPYLCQGCGDCTSACPSGALNYAWPGRELTLAGIFKELKRALDRVVVFCTDSTNWMANDDEKYIPVTVESVGSCGPEIWLASIAYGATGVRLQRKGLTRLSSQNLQSQMNWVNEGLEGLGYGAVRVDWDDGRRRMEKTPPFSQDTAADFAPLSDKRDVLNLALAHLCRHENKQAEEVIELPEGAPLGGLEIIQDNCTLCMACVNVCPVDALKSGMETPQLRFLELNCIQCGLCAEACPEGAIELRPRLLADRKKATEVRVLHEQTAFECVECGQAFATKKMIESILAKVGGNPMFADERQRKRLMMCGNCRVSDMLKDDE